MTSIGDDRLAGYKSATGGDLTRAVDLYLWNTSAAAACFEDLCLLEVAVRNAGHRQLSAWHAAEGHAVPWYFTTSLTPRHMTDVGRARERLVQGKRAETEGRVVAELTFGFWRLLHSKVYEHSLWHGALRHAYPSQPRSDREEVYTRLDHLNTLRNRIAHHEPSHGETIGRVGLDLAGVHDELRDVVGWIDSDLLTWLEAETRVPTLLAQKP